MYDENKYYVIFYRNTQKPLYVNSIKYAKSQI